MTKSKEDQIQVVMAVVQMVEEIIGNNPHKGKNQT